MLKATLCIRYLAFMQKANSKISKVIVCNCRIRYQIWDVYEDVWAGWQKDNQAEQVFGGTLWRLWPTPPPRNGPSPVHHRLSYQVVRSKKSSLPDFQKGYNSWSGHVPSWTRWQLNQQASGNLIAIIKAVHTGPEATADDAGGLKGNCVIEIKSPFSCADKSFKDASDINSLLIQWWFFCVKKAYYFFSYCDFGSCGIFKHKLLSLWPHY